jgi:hypothetical protein
MFISVATLKDSATSNERDRASDPSFTPTLVVPVPKSEPNLQSSFVFPDFETDRQRHEAIKKEKLVAGVFSAL